MTTTTKRGNSPKPDLSAELNATIDCEDLALRLGLERPGGNRGNFRSPHRTDKSPSVGVYRNDAGHSRWKDYSDSDSGGGPVDLLMWVRGLEFVDALRELAQMYGIQLKRPTPAGPVVKVEQTLPEFIAENCLKAAATDSGRADLLNYLQGRSIDREVVEQALKRRTLGLNTWCSKTVAKGEINHGGLAAAFIVRDQVSGGVVAVDMRYLQPEDNGGVKTQSQGEKSGFPWTSDWRKLEAARTVYVVESSINVLSIESCSLPATAAVSIRGTGNVDTIDWGFLRGKQVVACMDNDEPGRDGYCAGLKAAWRLHEVLTGLDISCMLVDQSEWFEDVEKREGQINDANDYLQLLGADALGKALSKLEGWMIPGMQGDDKRLGRARLYLPGHDFNTYWRYRVNLDFTKVIGKTNKDDDGNEKHEFADVAGFRIAAISRVTIASPTSTMTGDVDHSPRTVFALSVQVARHGPKLQRRVVDDEKLHNLDVWKKLGPVYAPTAFARLVNVWERAASIGAREAINFVGLAWRDGRPVVNEGPDCFFSDPRQQCPYSDLIFPGGPVSQGVEVIQQFQETFAENAALIPLVWALGAHLKAFLGFWPHFVMQAEKATGKSTLVKRIERAVAMVMKSRQSLQTEFRQLTSISYTSHPVGWGEMSTNKQDVITKAISNLQEAYQYEHTQRGAELIDFLLCAPVLLAGEDVPVDSLVGKLVRSELTKARRGPLIPETLPAFPVKQWLNYLCTLKKETVQQLHAQQVTDLFDNCVATTTDTGAERMVNNYAAIATAWLLLCDFTGLQPHQGGFLSDLTAEMNKHIAETVSDRQPWAWILDKLFSEISRREYRYPFKFEEEDEVPVLCVRTSHVMDHMRSTPYLREFWDSLPVKSDRVFKKQLLTAGVLVCEPNGDPVSVERTVGGNRVPHMVQLNLAMLKQYGLHAVVPTAKEMA